jgi:hypothetical protein
MWRNKNLRILVIVLATLLIPARGYADTSSSTNYRVDQTFFGSGGVLEASSANYKSKQTLGEIGIGNTASTNYGAYAGFNTSDAPYIEFVTTWATIDLGNFSSSSATTTNATFYVRAWQAEGYVVRTESNPPTNGTYTMNALTSQTASSAGTEQFGINLVSNTSPTTFGSAPQQVPDNTFSFGTVAAGYNTTNVYKYVSGDTIAQSTKSSSITIYTVSYLFNISDVTPAGQITFVHNMVATGTY